MRVSLVSSGLGKTSGGSVPMEERQHPVGSSLLWMPGFPFQCSVGTHSSLPWTSASPADSSGSPLWLSIQLMPWQLCGNRDMGWGLKLNET